MHTVHVILKKINYSLSLILFLLRLPDANLFFL